MTINLFLDLLLHGRICDVGPGSLPAEVEIALGAQYTDDTEDWYLRRDFGLAEFTFIRENDMRCGFVIVQVHRLLSIGTEIVPSVLAELYGEPSGHVNAKLLLRQAGELGVASRLDRFDEATGDSTYVVPSTGCLIHVDGEVDNGKCANDWPNPGEITKISIHDPLVDWWKTQYMV